MKFRISKVLTIVSFFIATAFLLDSCKKDTTCYGESTCMDLASGAVVPGATVKIFIDPKYNGFYPCDGGQFTQQTFTADASGKVSFCFKLAATPSILVTAGAKTGTGIIATEVGKTVSQTVKIK